MTVCIGQSATGATVVADLAALDEARQGEGVEPAGARGIEGEDRAGGIEVGEPGAGDLEPRSIVQRKVSPGAGGRTAGDLLEGCGRGPSAGL